MSLDYVSLSSNMNNIYDTLKLSPTVNPGTTWVTNFKINYDTDANNGTFSTPAVSMTNHQPLLNFIVSNSLSTRTNWAKSITDYWKAQIASGTPQHNGIVSVTNDAAKIETPIYNLLAGTTVSKTPPYEHIFQGIEDEVKTIVWTVTENLSGGGTTSYSVTIS